MASSDGQLTDEEVLGHLRPAADPTWDELWAAVDELVHRTEWATWASPPTP